MIYYSINNKSKKWHRRSKKINSIIKKILFLKKELQFSNNTNYYCNFILANDCFIKKLNYKYKKINKSTDVLTFVSNLNIKNKKKQKHCDIILSAETITKDAKRNNIDFYHHLTHLIVHSFLHINNYIHDKFKDYIFMKKKEIYILNQLNIDNPY